MELFNKVGLDAAELDRQLDELWAMSKQDRQSDAKNLYAEGVHLVASEWLPWGDVVRERMEREYLRFLHTEFFFTGDGSRRMQNEIAAMMGEVLGNPRAVGVMTTGGSESVISAMACAKYRAFAKRYPDVSPGDRYSRPQAAVEPNEPFVRFESEPKSVVMPLHQHYSAFKACALFGLEPITVAPRGEHPWEIDPDDIRDAVRDDTIAIFSTAGVWPYGSIDPIEEIGRIAEEHDLYLHVDACFGGFSIPFLELAGYFDAPLEPWDFRVPAVSSISADLHKNAMVAPPCSLLLFRDNELLDMAKVICPPFGILTGTRSAGPVAAGWTLLRSLGLEGMKQMALRGIAMRDELMDGMRRIPGVKVSEGSRMNLFGVYSEEIDLRPAVEAVRELGWVVASYTRPEPICMILVPLPQNEGMISRFVEDFTVAVRDHAVPIGELELDHEYSHYGGLRT